MKLNKAVRVVGEYLRGNKTEGAALFKTIPPDFCSAVERLVQHAEGR